MTTPTITISPLVVPRTLSDDDAGDFLAFAALNRRICDEEVGLPDLSPSAEELLPSWLDDTDTQEAGFVARVDGEILGMVSVAFAQEDGAQTAEIDLLVAEEHWGRGVEEALLARAEQESRSRGRSILQTWTLHRPIDAERMLTPGTGWGRIPATPLADLFAGAGYGLEQVERNSELDLHADDTGIRQALADAEAFAGADYRVISWNLPTPAELREGYASILARLSTDAPSGDMEFVAEHWDAERVIRRESRLLDGGQLVSVAAVQHAPTGALVAYNELVIAKERAGVTHQFGTLVAKEHRGHRLGTIVKCANLLRWRELVPAATVVSTFNAEENRPMLDINEAIGFVPVSYAGAWQKRI